MIKTENPNGYIKITNEYFAGLVGHAASSCFGVAGMADSNAVQSIRSMIRQKTNQDNYDKGVEVKNDEDGHLIINLHIAVSYGVNINAIVQSIINKVRYTVEEATDLEVKKVNVFVDEMKA